MYTYIPMYISTGNTIHTHVYTYSLVLPPVGLDLVTSCLLSRAYFAHSYTKAIASRMLLRQSATALPRAHCPNQTSRDAVWHMDRARTTLAPAFLAHRPRHRLIPNNTSTSMALRTLQLPTDAVLADQWVAAHVYTLVAAWPDHPVVPPRVPPSTPNFNPAAEQRVLLIDHTELMATSTSTPPEGKICIVQHRVCRKDDLFAYINDIKGPLGNDFYIQYWKTVMSHSLYLQNFPIMTNWMTPIISTLR